MIFHHNRAFGKCEIEQPKVGQQGETSGSERVKEHGGENSTGVAADLALCLKKSLFSFFLPSVLSVSSVVNPSNG